MTKDVKRHPHSYTLQLMRLALERLPAEFPADRREHYKEKLRLLEADTAADYETVRATAVDFGRESWPYRCAFEDLYDQYGRVSEEANLLRHLDAGLREKYEKFLHEGGKLNYLPSARSIEEMRQPAPFERYFTPEEKYAIEQSLIGARQSAREEIIGLVAGKKKAEFMAMVREHLTRQARMVGMIEELKILAKVSDKNRNAILESVRSFEEGWSLVERQPEERQLVEALEYWRGTLSSFLQ